MRGNRTTMVRLPFFINRPSGQKGGKNYGICSEISQ